MTCMPGGTLKREEMELYLDGIHFHQVKNSLYDQYKNFCGRILVRTACENG